MQILKVQSIIEIITNCRSDKLFLTRINALLRVYSILTLVKLELQYKSSIINLSISN